MGYQQLNTDLAYPSARTPIDISQLGYSHLQQPQPQSIPSQSQSQSQSIPQSIPQQQVQQVVRQVVVEAPPRLID